MKSAWLAACLVLAAVSAIPAVAAPQETVLYRFRVGPHGIGPDGRNPGGGLVIDPSGALYGTTALGGAPLCNCGTVFELAPPEAGAGRWTQRVLYRFRGGRDGGGPGSLVMDKSGALYGTTAAGGVGCQTNPLGCGTVFKLTPPRIGGTGWTHTVLYRFTGGRDGATPFGLIIDARGALYGGTESGGSSCGALRSCGTVFTLTPPAASGSGWTETVLHRFQAGPAGPLVMDAEGALYGTTGYLYSNCCGTVFKLAPPRAGETPWTATRIYRFKDEEDGQFPALALVDAGGTLYGTTEYGGGGAGSVFALAPPEPGRTLRSKTVLYSFRGVLDGHDGAIPIGVLIMDARGVLYGATYGGGEVCFPSGCGTVFALAPPAAGGTGWTETVLYQFESGLDGENPTGLVMDASGTLYGTTTLGGAPLCNCGTVFRLVP